MAKFFNTTGPCNPSKHYMLSAEKRLVNARLDKYVDEELYWVLHAPRQTGKTTFLHSWMHQLNTSGKAVACYVSVESCQEFGSAEDAIPMIVHAVRNYAQKFGVPVPPLPQKEVPIGQQLMQCLSDWANLCNPKPLVVLFDEVDVLQDQALVSFLRQLRGGFAARGVGKFPVSVALVGMRDLRDYLIRSKDGVPLNPGSPFNIKQHSLTLRNFSGSEVQELALQHTAETGQVFDSQALDLAYQFTRGQPWLTNALLQNCTWELCPNGETITAEHMEQAKEMLIRQRATHLDSLAVRLREPRVRRIVQTILTGDMDPQMAEGDDFVYAIDLGIIEQRPEGVCIANPLYQEVIARVLSDPYQIALPQPEFAWQKPDGSLDMQALLSAFQKFWRRHGELWEAKADYTEAFPHLLLMAFLQRILNGGGRIEREYAAGRGRMDIAVFWQNKTYILEIKLWRDWDTLEAVTEEGIRQISRYRDTTAPEAECYLVIFDRRREKADWEKRLYLRKAESADNPIILAGM